LIDKESTKGCSESDPWKYNDVIHPLCGYSDQNNMIGIGLDCDRSATVV